MLFVIINYHPITRRECCYCRAAASQPCPGTIQAGFPDETAGFLPEAWDKGLRSGTGEAQV